MEDGKELRREFLRVLTTFLKDFNIHLNHSLHV